MDKIAALSEILAQNPADSFARYGLAMALATEGRTEEALKEFQRLGESSHAAQCLSSIACTYALQCDYDLAAETLQEAQVQFNLIEAYDGSAWSSWYLAQALWDGKHYEQGLAQMMLAYEKFLALLPQGIQGPDCAAKIQEWQEKLVSIIDSLYAY